MQSTPLTIVKDMPRTPVISIMGLCGGPSHPRGDLTLFSATPAQTLRCPTHESDLTPTEARRLAIDLVMMADALEGWSGLTGFVTRWEVLAELATLRHDVAMLRAEQDY